MARAVAEQGVVRNIVRAIGPCPPPLQAHYGADRASIRWVLAEENAGATSQGHVSVAASGAVACVTKTLPWKPSDRLACEELLQDTWMQASSSQSQPDSTHTGAGSAAGTPPWPGSGDTCSVGI